MKYSNMFLVLVLLCLYSGDTIHAAGDEVCVLIKNCRSAWNLNSYELQNRICGYENNRYPKIWCTIPCTTPDSERGVCTDADSCEPFTTFFRNSDPNDAETVSYLRQFVCNSISTRRKHYICCPNKPLNGNHGKPPTPVAPVSEEQCGIASESFKVVGGSIADLGDHPWAALLQYYSRGQYSFKCGGTLINRRYIVTAAHCINEREGKLLNVVLGEHNTTSPIDCYANSCAPKPKVYRVEKVTQHPGWINGRPQFYDDIALLRLAEDVEFSEFIQPICLPSSNYVPTYSTKLTVAGWGRADNAESSDVKRVATLYLQDSERCLNTVPLPLKQSQLCIGGGFADSCKGDSGGPLMMSVVGRNGIPVWHLVGVVSLGYDSPCGTPDKPGIYTSIAYNLKWIKENMF